MGIITILGGALAASTYIIKQNPNAKEYLDKLFQYQGYIGIALFIYGLWFLFSFLGYADILINFFPLKFIIVLLTIIVNLLLGLLLGYHLMSDFASAKVQETGKNMRDKLLIYQEKIGIAGIILGILSLIV